MTPSIVWQAEVLPGAQIVTLAKGRLMVPAGPALTDMASTLGAALTTALVSVAPALEDDGLPPPPPHPASRVRAASKTSLACLGTTFAQRISSILTPAGIDPGM
jgi:hypothetical protein